MREQGVEEETKINLQRSVLAVMEAALIVKRIADEAEKGVLMLEKCLTRLCRRERTCQGGTK